VASLVSKKEDVEKKKGETKDISVGLIVVVGLVVLLMIYSTNINPARANTGTLNIIRELNRGQDVSQMYNEITKISSPHIDDIRNDVSRVSVNIITKLSQEKRNEEAIKLFDLANTQLKKNLELHPMDIRVNIQLAQLDILGAQLKQDIQLLFEAEKYLEEALFLSPKRQQLQYTLSGLKLQLNKPNEAIKLLQDSIDNDSKIGEGWWRLALVYQQMGDIDKAKKIIQDALSKDVVFGDQGKNVINSILTS